MVREKEYSERGASDSLVFGKEVPVRRYRKKKPVRVDISEEVSKLEADLRKALRNNDAGLYYLSANALGIPQDSLEDEHLYERGQLYSS